MTNRLSLFILLCIVSIFTACKSSKKTAVAATTETTAMTGDKFFKISQGPCFGKCPVYDMTLMKDSTLRLVGKNFLNYIGNYKLKLTGEQYNEVMNAYKAIKLDTFRNTYTNNITDIAAVTYYFFDASGMKKQIMTQGIYPEPLQNLTLLTRKYLNGLGWEQDSKADSVNPDELIIQMKEGQKIESVIDENWKFKLYLKQTLSKSGIYLIGFDKTTITQDQLINNLKGNPNVMFVEKNNKVELR